MASRVKTSFQVDNLNFHLDGHDGRKKPNVSQGQPGRSALGAKNERMKEIRKPLQDLCMNNSENVGSTTRNKVLSKANNSAAGKHKRSGRKPLGDVSNFVQDPTNLSRLRTKSESASAKPLPVETELMSPDSARDEGWLHNHRECVKAQKQSTMGFDYFLETVGLSTDFSAPTSTLTPRIPMAAVSATSMLQTPVRYQEADDLPMVDEASNESPPHSPSPATPMQSTDRKNLDLSGFKLQDTP